MTTEVSLEQQLEMKQALRKTGVVVDLLEDIAEFHTKFGLPPVSNTPSLLEIPDMAYRIQFLFEEMQELVDAFEEEDLEKQFDALIDLVYVAIGTAYLMGLPFGEGWSRVHEANMKKVRADSAEDKRSKRGHKWDVVKPEGWESPYLKDLVTPIIIGEEAPQ